jgi:hypothetical protein
VKQIFFSLLIMCVILSACKQKESELHSTSMPDAKEVLTLDPKADIFLWNNTVYKTNIDWVEELPLTKSKELGEITSISVSTKDHHYKNGMANKLPIGAKIYTAEERKDVLLVEKDGKLFKYLGIGEG